MYSDARYDAAVPTFDFTIPMAKFRLSIIILGQVLQISTRSSPAVATTFYHKNVVLGSNSQQSPSMSKPDSISWTQSRLGALYEVREDEAFASAFDVVFSPSCEVRVNHTPSTLDTFRESVLSRKAASRGVALSWENLISTGDNPDEPSVVSGTLIITRSMMFLIRAAPAQRLTYINFSARVERVESSGVQADENDDRRRITSLYHTSVDKVPPIHFAKPHPVSNQEERV
ncbi:hypothetical protein DFH29DRAFT_911056 [Suillus ampliporus]|nr:hypothetical protein DFH29DRAFT_911056 [Suillus ampliporus]